MDYNSLYEDKQQNYYYHSRAEMLQFVPKGIQLALDVGCGSGEFGALLKAEHSCEVWGIEPSKSAAQEAEKKLDKVINDLFVKDMDKLKGQKFDAIFFNDVLEHLVDPNEALSCCKSLLKPTGHIIASIPSIRWYPVVLSLLRYKDFKYQESGVMDKTHLRFFTKKSMCRMFENNGFKVVRCEGINKDNTFKVFNILNFLLFNSQEDMKFPQFAIVAAHAD